MKKRLLLFSIFTVVIIVVSVVSAVDFTDMWSDPPIVPGKGISEIKMLSDWLPSIKDTSLDTEVYVFKGEAEGGKALILGGTHPNEPAGVVAGVTLIENMEITAGTVYIIPRANHSAFTHTDPMEGSPEYFDIKLPDNSVRTFRYGSRRTNPIHQWPDPTLYNHPSGSTLGGGEVTNLNRAYPGRADGYATEKVGYAILQLIKEEGIDVACDLHESSPEYPVNNAIVFHQKSAELAITTQMMLEMEEVDIRLEESPVNLRGLSHREWGDYTDVQPILLEVANPVQGRLRGKTDEALILTGIDKFYLQASKDGKLFAPYDENGYPIDLRVARHIAVINSLFESWNMLYGDKPIITESVPSYSEITEKGIGAFLNPFS